MTFDPYRFGNSIASVQLAQRLENADRRTAKRIACHIQEFNEGLHALSSLPFPKHRTRMAKLWLTNFINHELKIVNFSDFNLDDTMKNVIHYRYRLWLEHENILNKQQQADRIAKNAREAAKAEEWVKNNIP